MTDTKDVAASWLQGLAARGITTRIVNGRIRHFPASAYRQLTDDEILVLRHHRAEIKAAISAGIRLEVRHAPAAQEPAPAVERAAPKPEPSCKWCNRAPCIGDQHPAFYTLHPEAEQKRADERLNKEFRLVFGMDPWPR